MAGEITRRVILSFATLLCCVYVAIRGLDIKLSLPLNAFLKSIPIVLLSFVAILHDSPDVKGNKLATGIGRGLVLCSFGDVALEIENGFLPGLFLFLAGHLFYTTAVSPLRLTDIRKDHGMQGVGVYFILTGAWWSIVFASYLTIVDGAPSDMRPPVAIYCAVIGVMVYRVLNHRDLVAGRSSYLYVAFGALSFAFSDFVLGYNKFVTPIGNASTIVMIFYVSIHI